MIDDCPFEKKEEKKRRKSFMVPKEYVCSILVELSIMIALVSRKD